MLTAVFYFVKIKLEKLNLILNLEGSKMANLGVLFSNFKYTRLFSKKVMFFLNIPTFKIYSYLLTFRK